MLTSRLKGRKILKLASQISSCSIVAVSMKNHGQFLTDYLSTAENFPFCFFVRKFRMHQRFALFWCKKKSFFCKNFWIYYNTNNFESFVPHRCVLLRTSSIYITKIKLWSEFPSTFNIDLTEPFRIISDETRWRLPTLRIHHSNEDGAGRTGSYK